MTNTRPKCLRCHADSQTHLCRACTTRTRNTLRGLPRLLRHLREAAIGQTRLGDIGRHTPYRSRHELHGDTNLAAHIEPLPPRDQWDKPVTYTDNDNPDPADDPADLYESRQARQTAALRKLLAAGGVNERASTLHATITDCLTTWTRDLAETHHLDTSMIGSPADMCIWLAHHHQQLAQHPAADEISDELEEKTRAILRIINRPVPPRYVGPCPVIASDGTRCDTALQAPRQAEHVTCPNCHTDHDITELGAQLLAGAGDYWLNQTDLLFAMAAMGKPIPGRTWREWRRTKRIPEIHVSGEPRYRIADAVALLEVKPQAEATGAAAKEYGR